MIRNPYLAADLRHQKDEDDQAGYRDWLDQSLEFHRSIYLESKDLGNAIATLENGDDLGRQLLIAIEEGNITKAQFIASLLMETAAQVYAKEQSTMEERMMESAREQGTALLRAVRRGKVPDGYDD